MFSEIQAFTFHDMVEPFRAVIEGFLLSYHAEFDKKNFEKQGERMFLKQYEDIEMINAIKKKLDEKVPYVRRNYTKTTRIRTVIREEPIKLAQHIKDMHTIFSPFAYVGMRF